MVITVRDLTFKRLMSDYSWYDRVTRNSRIRKACAKADRVIATSEFIKQQIIDRYGTNPDKIDVIYTAFRQEYATSKKDGIFLNNVKNKYHMPSRFILAITYFNSLSNLETLYRAFAKLEDKNIDLVLIGRKNDNYRKLKRLASELGIRDRIVRVSSVNKHNFMALYALAEAFVDTSIDDGIGQTVIESMIIGTPAIVSDSGCHREVGGDAALYFNPTDDDQLAKRIDSVLKDEAKRQSMADAGIKQASQFTQQAMAQNIMRTYNRARGRE